MADVPVRILDLGASNPMPIVLEEPTQDPPQKVISSDEKSVEPDMILNLKEQISSRRQQTTDKYDEQIQNLENR